MPPSNRATISRFPQASNPKLDLVTICHSRGRSLFVLKHLLVEVFRLDWAAFGYILGEKSGLAWFDEIVPANWLEASDVKRGRSRLNFSEIGKLLGVPHSQRTVPTRGESSIFLPQTLALPQLH